jgi:hypothetical protein
MDTNFVVYGYLRRGEDRFGRRGTLYYIGKGRPGRPYVRFNRRVKVPMDVDRIWIIHRDINEKTALKFEIELIKIYQRQDVNPECGILKNMTDGGEGATGRKQSKETKRKISEKNKGQKRSLETRKRMSLSNRLRSYGEEARKNMSNSKRGSKNHNFGKPRAESTREKISEGNMKRIYWYNTSREITIFASSKELIDMYPTDELLPSSLSNVLSGKRNTHKGWIRAKKLRQKKSE